MHIIFRLLILVASIFVASYIIPGVKVESLTTLFVVAIVIGIINAFIKPILVILTLPLTIITLGIFLLVLNGLLILLVGQIVPGFEVSGLLSAILFSIVVSLVGAFLGMLSAE